MTDPKPKQYRVTIDLTCPSYWTPQRVADYMGKLAAMPQEKESIKVKEIADGYYT